MRRRFGSQTLALVLALSGTSCNLTQDGTKIPFNSGPDESAGMAGKSWGTPAYLEINSSNPDVVSQITHQGFDLKTVDDSSAVLLSAFVDPVSGFFQPYARLYTQATGWALPGSQFRRLNSLAADVGQVGLGLSPGGTLLQTSVDSGNNASAMAYDSGAWAAADTPVALGASPAFSTTAVQDYGPAIKIIQDKLGRAYVATLNQATPEDGVLVADWTAGGGLLAAAAPITAPGATGHLIFDAIFDGVDEACFTQETGAGCLASPVVCNLQYICNDTVTSTAGTEVTGTENVFGHALATDGKGKVMVAYYRRTGATTWAIYAGKLGSTMTQLDASLPSGYEALPDACTELGCAGGEAYPKPAIGYAGSGSFVVMWQAVSTADQVSGLFYSVYTKLDGWTTAKQAGEAFTYDTRPRFGNPQLAFNSVGDATLAVPFLTTDGPTLDDQIYKTMVGRFHPDVGLKKITFVGDGCANGAGVAAPCTTPPRPVIFEDGDGLVVYGDQDSSSRYRLKAIEFTR